ncbi:tripartite tricarboxylate transporter TctB family protein [Vibrio ziniensis]|uniref:Tripartite tricarboxylate transporter TctB family protein n=1 Tax=Vibrio ziniensis TaxID=2711221 RepID=A0A6G7CMM6_9VIBR|nr:tripartite tricarboxylate transporter TctB family protein [Vibrio ziniensis]QIH43387.1 tripartite tricarboxylate transporter TctB family protein [Vibrio ziniensis]
MVRVHEKHIFYMLLIMGLGYFTHMSLQIPELYGVVGDPGPGFIPFWFSLIAEVLLVYLLVTEVFLHKDDAKNVSLSKHEIFSLSITVFLVVSYLLSLSYIGFVVSTVVFLFIYKLLADYMINDIKPSRSSIAISMVFSGASTTAIYVIFGVLFKLSLP